MVDFLIRLMVMAGVVWAVAHIVPGLRIRGFWSSVLVALLYSLCNFVLFKIFFFVTFPLIILKVLTLGLFSIVINGGLLWITSRLMRDFEIDSFGAALVAGAGISVANLALAWVL